MVMLAANYANNEQHSICHRLAIIHWWIINQWKRLSFILLVCDVSWREYTFNSIFTFSPLLSSVQFWLCDWSNSNSCIFSENESGFEQMCVSLSFWQPVEPPACRGEPRRGWPGPTGPGGPSGAALTSTFPHLNTPTPAAGLRAAEGLIMEHIPIDVASLHQKRERAPAVHVHSQRTVSGGSGTTPRVAGGLCPSHQVVIYGLFWSSYILRNNQWETGGLRTLKTL